ncbi:MAG: bifunctional 3-(3-hydroxy-phenyl)propionate/3-hydroxycinnamic acid hydroxylase [Flavobacteriales bacterium]|nr:bifunctional 3-(3-hydroxy-phenyl)propionate/3-hydroxycinnamic acid hydroxylase [Flavobacteriales bacterium]
MNGQYDTEVVIVGGGPTGLMLANLLGACGVKTIVLEREKDVFPVPRATHIDEETVRNFTLTGLMPELAKHISPFGNVEVADSKGRVILTEHVGLISDVHGKAGSFFFDQPAFETILRHGLKRYAHVLFLPDTEVLKIDQHANGVTVFAKDRECENERTVHAQYAVGCDGGRSLVRKSLDISMHQMAPSRDWLIVDATLKDMNDAALLPQHFQYRMGLDRLMLYAHGHGQNRRWEFRLQQGEEHPDRSEVIKWISAFIEPEKLNILRMTPYTQRAQIAEKWRVGRILLAGDAAHLMPPSAGQGMCSGIRDAVNLAWKLRHVLQFSDRDGMLNSYQTERQPHLTKMLNSSMFISNRLNAESAVARLWKYAQILFIGTFSPIRDLMRSQLLSPIPLSAGFFQHSLAGGQHVPRFEDQDGQFTDVWPYAWAVVGAADAFGPSLMLRLGMMGIHSVGNRLEDAMLESRLNRWLKDNDATFAIIRPDRIVYCFTGKHAIHAQLDVLERRGVGYVELANALELRHGAA